MFIALECGMHIEAIVLVACWRHYCVSVFALLYLLSKMVEKSPIHSMEEPAKHFSSPILRRSPLPRGPMTPRRELFRATGRKAERLDKQSGWEGAG